MERTAGTARRVVACGLATLDVVQTVDRLPAPDEKVVARGLWVGAGGPAANAAVTAAALGACTTLVSRVGGGPVARLVLDDLHAHGVEVLDLAPAGASPAVSTVLVTASTGERAVVSVNATTPHPLAEMTTSVGGPSRHADGSRHLGERGDEGAGAAQQAWRPAVASAGAVLVDGHHLDLALEVAAAARSAGVPVLLDGGSWKPGLEHLLAITDLALLSADFRLPDGPGTPAALLRAVRRLGPVHVARSQGSGPVQLLVDHEVVEVGVPAVEVRDTLGAGDVLHGALAAWLAVHGLPDGPRGLEPGLAYAAHVASSSCTAEGASGWLADADALGAARAALLR